MNSIHEFSATELRKLRSLKNPHGIQRFIDDMPYRLADTAWSPQRVLRENKDTDHVVAIYRVHGHWGAIAKSNFTGCRYREPVYRSLRELAMSYFDAYFNLRRERSLRTFSRPVNLARFDHRHWMTTDQPLWFIAEYLFTIHHYRLITPAMVRNLHRLDNRSFKAGCLGRAEKKIQNAEVRVQK